MIIKSLLQMTLITVECRYVNIFINAVYINCFFYFSDYIEKFFNILIINLILKEFICPLIFMFVLLRKYISKILNIFYNCTEKKFEI